MRSFGSKVTFAILVAAASVSASASSSDSTSKFSQATTTIDSSIASTVPLPNHSTDTCESSLTMTHHRTAPLPTSTDSGLPVCVFCTPVATHTHTMGSTISLHTASSCTTVMDCTASTPPWGKPSSIISSIPATSLSSTSVSVPASAVSSTSLSTGPWLTDTSSVTTIYQTVPCTDNGTASATTPVVPASSTSGSGTNGTVTTSTAKLPPPTVTTSGAQTLASGVGATMKKCFLALAVLGFGVSML